MGGRSVCFHDASKRRRLECGHSWRKTGRQEAIWNGDGITIGKGVRGAIRDAVHAAVLVSMLVSMLMISPLMVILLAALIRGWMLAMRTRALARILLGVLGRHAVCISKRVCGCHEIYIRFAAVAHESALSITSLKKKEWMS